MAAYRAEVLADSPSGYWRLGEPSGVTAADDSPNNRPGTYSNAPSLAQGSLIPVGDAGNTSVVFNGTTQSMTVPDNPAWDVGAGGFTVEAWIKPNAIGGTVKRMVSQREAAAGWGFGITIAGGLRLTSYGIKDHDSTVSPLVINTTYHVVARMNADKTVDFFVNGAKIGATVAAGATFPVASAAVLAVAQRGDSVEWFSGGMDEVAVYPTALSDARILAHYTAGITSPTGSTNVARQGEVRDSVSGALAWTLNPVNPTKLRGGELRDANGALVCTTTVAGCAFRQGEMKNAAGAYLIALSPGAGSPRWRQGDYRDSNGALLYLPPPGTNPKMKQGYVRDQSGPLIATVT